MEFYAVEPFGEQRDDLRTAAQSLWLMDAFAGGGNEEVRLFHPYFPGADERQKQHQALLDREQQLGDAHKEKLRKARQEHLAKMKAEKRG